MRCANRQYVGRAVQCKVAADVPTGGARSSARNAPLPSRAKRAVAFGLRPKGSQDLHVINPRGQAANLRDSRRPPGDGAAQATLSLITPTSPSIHIPRPLRSETEGQHASRPDFPLLLVPKLASPSFDRASSANSSTPRQTVPVASLPPALGTAPATARYRAQEFHIAGILLSPRQSPSVAGAVPSPGARSSARNASMPSVPNPSASFHTPRLVVPVASLPPALAGAVPSPGARSSARNAVHLTGTSPRLRGSPTP